MQPDKNLLKNNFITSCPYYPRHARVQKKMAARLLILLKLHTGCSFPTVFEAGCGTGFFTGELLALDYTRFFVNDLAAEFASLITKLSPGIVFIAGDAENRAIYPENIDLLASNAAVQWFHDLEAWCRLTHSLLNHNGVLCFSTFGPDNLQEFGNIPEKLQYYPAETLRSMFGKLFVPVCLLEEYFIMEFKTAAQVLAHLKKTGVNSLQKGLMGKKKLAAVSETLAASSKKPGCFTLTYNPIYCIFRKNN